MQQVIIAKPHTAISICAVKNRIATNNSSANYARNMKSACTQLIFSDLSTPKGRAEPKKEEAKESAEGTETEGEAAATEEETAMEASVYEDIRKKLIAKGIPPQEIAFIHDANTETQKAELFAKVRNIHLTTGKMTKSLKSVNNEKCTL